MDDWLWLRCGALEAAVSPVGAELVALRHAAFGELLWSGDAAWWDRRSPILFPVVGRSMDDRIVIDCRTYPMPMHGFAHSARFDVVEASEARCRLVLKDSASTRILYPFGFRLELDYRLDEAGLSVVATIGNPGNGPLPASFGFHPGFRWPLQDHLAKSDHFIDFPDDGGLDVHRAEAGYILAEATRTELDEGRLWLDEGLFAPGAMALRTLKSRRVTFGARGGEFAIDVAFENLPMFALWMRPGAAFLCIEPWSGHGDPAGFAGELRERPGITLIAPGATRRHAMTVRIGNGALLEAASD